MLEPSNTGRKKSFSSSLLLLGSETREISGSCPKDPRGRAVPRPQITCARFKQGYLVNDLAREVMKQQTFELLLDLALSWFEDCYYTQSSSLRLSSVCLEPLVKSRVKLL